MIINTSKKQGLIKKILYFIYYLRYLIFFFICIVIILFLSPKFFKHVDKIESLNNILENQHGFVIENYDDIKYKIFPQPNLEIKNSKIKISKEIPKLKLEKIKVFLNVKGLYKPEKILLKNIKFRGNFLGNDINGYYFPKKNINILYFRLENLGIESKVFFDNKKKLNKPSGIMKLDILDHNLIFNFDYNKIFKFSESIIKNKNLKAELNGYLKFDPFFYFNITTEIKRINYDKFNLKKIKHLLIKEISDKKLNGELVINNATKKIIGKERTKKLSLNLLFKNGDIISNNSFFKFFNFDVKLKFYLKKYPSYKNLDYELSIKNDDINKFYKKIDIKKNKKLDEVKILMNGNVNLEAQKYYFNNIKINEKDLKKNELIKLKNYFDKNASIFFNGDLNEKRVYLFLKELIEFI